MALDLGRKRLATDIRPLAVVAWLTTLQALICLPLLYWAEPPTASYWVPASITIVANIAANWLFVMALSMGHFSRTVPLLSLTPAFAALFGFLRLGESLDPLQMLGIGLVSVGAFLLGRDGKRSGGDSVELRAFFYMLGVAFLWGFNAPFDKQATTESSVIFHVFFQGFGLALGFVGLLAMRRQIGEMIEGRKHFGFILLAAVLGLGALGFQLAAYTRMDVALVETIKRVTGLVMALSLGRWLFAESITKWKLIAAILMAMGLPLVLFK